MSLYSFNIGTDAAVDVSVDGFPTPFSLGYVTNWGAKPNTQTVVIGVVTNGGKEVGRRVPKGYTGSFTVARQNGALEDLEQYFQDNFYNGGPEIYSTIHVTINNVDGTVSQYQFPNAILYMTNLGDNSREKEIDQTIEFWAPERVAVA